MTTEAKTRITETYSYHGCSATSSKTYQIVERSASHMAAGSMRRSRYLRRHKLALPQAESSLQGMSVLKTGTRLWSMILLERTLGLYWGRFNYKNLTINWVDVLTTLRHVVPTAFLESWTTFMHNLLLLKKPQMFGDRIFTKKVHSVPHPNQERIKQQWIVEGVIWSQAIQLRHVHPGQMTHLTGAQARLLVHGSCPEFTDRWLEIM